MEIPLVCPPMSRNLKAKKIILAPGEEIGAHVTDNREEVVVVISGEATLALGRKRITLGAGEARFIPAETAHNIRNDGAATLEYVYVVSLFSGKGTRTD